MKAIFEKKANEKFAQKNNLSIDEMNAKAQKVFESLPEVDPKTQKPMSEDARWARAYRRVRGAFQKKAKTMNNAKDGMIVCRMTNRDFDRNQYDYAMRVVLKDGEEAALAQGLINKDGNPIYRWGDAQGRPILNQNKEPGRPQVSGRAIAYTFEKNDDDEYTNIDSRYMIISKTKADNVIPVCQIGKLSLSIADEKVVNFFNQNYFAYYNDSSVSGVHTAPYDYEEVQEILGQWNQAFGEHLNVISNAKDLEEFSQNHSYSKDNKKCEYDFCVIPGIVSAIDPGASKYHNDAIVLEFIDYDTLETTVLTIYMPKEMLKGLCMQEDDQGIFVLQSSSYTNKNGETKHQWHLGGFLPVDDNVDIEEFFGIAISDGEEDDSE